MNSLVQPYNFGFHTFGTTVDPWKTNKIHSNVDDQVAVHRDKFS